MRVRRSDLDAFIAAGTAPAPKLPEHPVAETVAGLSPEKQQELADAFAALSTAASRIAAALRPEA